MGDIEEAADLFDTHSASLTVDAKAILSRAAPVRAMASSLLEAARSKLAGLEKFVQDAVVAPQGKADMSTFLPLVRRMGAVGLVTGFAILVPDGEAQAWGRPVGAGYGQSSIGAGFQAFRERRREIRRERETTALAAGAGLVGGLLLGGVIGNGNQNHFYQQRPVYPQPYNPYGAGYGSVGQSYGAGYGNSYPVQRPAYAGGYGNNSGGIVPSDAFTLMAKTLIAARIGSVEQADRIYDRFLREAAACTAQLGPSAQCVTRFQEVSLDLGRGEFIAAADGQPVVVERHGQLNRIRPDILQGALERSKEIKATELYGNRGY